MTPGMRTKLMKVAPAVLPNLLLHGHPDQEAGTVHRGMRNRPIHSSGGACRSHHRPLIDLWTNR
uniref:Uncharacterized protein n=1 Tax=Arundo donax TaxID=35708 RepID=A0A0A9AFP4_ARUDO